MRWRYKGFIFVRNLNLPPRSMPIQLSHFLPSSGYKNKIRLGGNNNGTTFSRIGSILVEKILFWIQLYYPLPSTRSRSISVIIWYWFQWHRIAANISPNPQKRGLIDNSFLYYTVTWLCISWWVSHARTIASNACLCEAPPTWRALKLQNRLRIDCIKSQSTE